LLNELHELKKISMCPYFSCPPAHPLFFSLSVPPTLSRLNFPVMVPNLETFTIIYYILQILKLQTWFFLIRNKIKKFQNNYKLNKFKIKALKHLWRMWSCSFKQTRLQCKRTWVGFSPRPRQLYWISYLSSSRQQT